MRRTYLLSFFFPLPTQLVVFARTKFGLTSFIQQNQRTFTQLFIHNAVQTDEDDPIPTPIAKIYTFDDLYNQLDLTTSMVCGTGEWINGRMGGSGW